MRVIKGSYRVITACKCLLSVHFVSVCVLEAVAVSHLADIFSSVWVFSSVPILMSENRSQRSMMRFQPLLDV